jgi:DNA-binding transcriptional regulator PaaX
MTSKGRLKILKKKIFKKWDGLWRIIAFDIEEKRKKTRDVFRIKLSEIGCKPIQKSVWITPNDISYELEEIIDILNLHNNVDYFISKAITNPDKLLEKFKLSNFKE